MGYRGLRRLSILPECTVAVTDELHLLPSYKSLLVFSSPVDLPDAKMALFILPIKINPHNFFHNSLFVSVKHLPTAIYTFSLHREAMRRRDKNEEVLSWVELFLYKQCETLFCTRLEGVEATLTVEGYHLHI